MYIVDTTVMLINDMKLIVLNSKYMSHNPIFSHAPLSNRLR